MYDRDNGMDGLPFGQVFVPAPIIARNSSGMDSLPQFLLRERSDYFVVPGNVNRVFHTIVCSLVDSSALSPRVGQQVSVILLLPLADLSRLSLIPCAFPILLCAVFSVLL